MQPTHLHNSPGKPNNHPLDKLRPKAQQQPRAPRPPHKGPSVAEVPRPRHSPSPETGKPPKSSIEHGNDASG
jgi:hypothetical protein